jgi:hypothetical protein
MTFTGILAITVSHILFGLFCFWAGRNPVEARNLWESIKKLLRSLKKDKAPTPEEKKP